MTLMDINAIALLLDLNPAHVRDRLTKRRDFPPAYRIGGALRWKREDLDDWIEARRVTPAARRSTRRAPGSKRAASTDSSAPTSAQALAVAESSTAE
jgi:prophage regulatory protein